MILGESRRLGVFRYPASITGAPKNRTMQIIAELETAPRQIYTGAIGFMAPNQTAQFNVAIRTILVNKHANEAEYGVGGGIVWDSEECDELRECQTKAAVLTQAMPQFDLLETICWTPDESYLLLERHLCRLAGSADYFSRPCDLSRIRQELAQVAERMPSHPHRIRLLLSPSGAISFDIQAISSLPKTYRVGIAGKPVTSNNPFLYHKTTHREVYDAARKAMPDCDDVILWNHNHEITESCIANIVVEISGRLLTPPISCGLLPGTYREELLEQNRIHEAIITLDDLRQSKNTYLMNSVRGMWRIVVID